MNVLDTEQQARMRLLKRTYCELLRQARRHGWQAAKSSYLPREREYGRRVEEILADLEFFEILNRQAIARGIDPIVAQRRRDLYERGLRPLVVVIAAAVVAFTAAHGASVTEAITGGTLLTWAGLGLAKLALVP